MPDAFVVEADYCLRMTRGGTFIGLGMGGDLPFEFSPPQLPPRTRPVIVRWNAKQSSRWIHGRWETVLVGRLPDGRPIFECRHQRDGRTILLGWIQNRPTFLACEARAVEVLLDNVQIKELVPGRLP
jgi:hypothetical protein